MRPVVTHYAAVALGSALGALARFLLSFYLHTGLGEAFPWGTFAANGIGSFLIGLYFALAGPGGRMSENSTVRHFVAAGFCGGFTTFSIFSLETLWLFEQGAHALGAFHVLGSLALWLAAVFVGYAAGRRLNRMGAARRGA